MKQVIFSQGITINYMTEQLIENILNEDFSQYRLFGGDRFMKELFETTTEEAKTFGAETNVTPVATDSVTPDATDTVTPDATDTSVTPGAHGATADTGADTDTTGAETDAAETEAESGGVVVGGAAANDAALGSGGAAHWT